MSHGTDGAGGTTDQSTAESAGQVTQGSRGRNAGNGRQPRQGGKRGGGRRERGTQSGTGRTRSGQQEHRASRDGAGQSAAGGHSGGVPTALRLVPIALVMFGVPAVYVGIQVLTYTEKVSRYGPSGAGSSLTFAGLVSLVIGVGYLVAAYGTWSFKPWSWKLSVGLFAAGALSSLLFLANGLGGPGLFGLLINGGLGWYLYSNRSLYMRFVGPSAGTSPAGAAGNHR